MFNKVDDLATSDGTTSNIHEESARHVPTSGCSLDSPEGTRRTFEISSIQLVLRSKVNIFVTNLSYAALALPPGDGQSAHFALKILRSADKGSTLNISTNLPLADSMSHVDFIIFEKILFSHLHNFRAI